MANSFYSPLRYPGGKTILAPFIKNLFYENKLVGRHYVEPFSGGAGVALSLLIEEYVSTITINDFDRSIYAFWHSVLNENKQFCRKIQTTPIDMRTWELQKQVQKDKENADLFELGFSTFFLNRTNISGVIKGGVIGGKEQLGKYKMTARFNRESLTDRIDKIGQYRSRINVLNRDALELVRDMDKCSFVYLDPPYVNKANNLYMNYYDEDDHLQISEFLLSKDAKFPWLLSYDDTELVNRLYRGCKSRRDWNLGYGSSNKMGSELLFSSKGLTLNG